MATISAAARVTTLTGAILFAALCSAPLACCKHGRIEPGFAGVPERLDRSDDVPLPLDEAGRRHCLEFMAAEGSRLRLDEGQIDRGALAAADRAFDAIFDRLSEPTPPTTEDLKDGAALRRLFGDSPPLQIHDARVGPTESEYYDLATDESVGFVVGDWVFALALRRLEPVEIAGEDGVIAWRLLPEADRADASAPRRYTSLVVFSSTFARPQEAE